MNNKFKDYGFKRKMFTGLECTGVRGEALKGTTYGYTRSIKVKEDLEITFNILPYKGDWICEKRSFNPKVFSELFNFEIEDYKAYQEFNGSEFEYAMKELGYTDKDYLTTSRWANMPTKEEALEEIIAQYPYLFES